LILSQDQTLVWNLIVCRRVEGRLSSPPLETVWWRPLRSEDPVAYLVRSFRLSPEHSSHDWHVQPSCQRTESPSAWAVRLQSSPEPHKCESDCPRNLFKVPSCHPPVNPLCPQVFHLLSTFLGSYHAAKPQSFWCATKRLFRFRRNAHSAHAEAEDSWVNKRSLWRFCE